MYCQIPGKEVEKGCVWRKKRYHAIKITKEREGGKFQRFLASQGNAGHAVRSQSGKKPELRERKESTHMH